MDQPALSRHVQKLESALGFKLFIRGNRRIELTEPAELFIPFARKALLAASAGVRVAQAASRGEPQELEVAYSTAVNTRVVAGIKSLVEGAATGISVRFRSFPDHLVVSRLFDGSSHIAIALMPTEAEVAATCILREQIYLVVPVRNEMVGKQSVSLGQIGDSPVVWPTGAMAAAVSRELFTRFRTFGYSPNVRHEAQTVAEALGLAREGVGVTFVKESDLVFVGAGLISIRLDRKVHIETGLIHVQELRWDSLRTFIAAVADQFRLPGTS